MSCNLPDAVCGELLALARKYRLQKLIVLPQDENPRSPIRLAVRGGNTIMFAMEANNPLVVRTLRRVLVSSLEGAPSEKDAASLQKGGVVLLGTV